MFTSNEAGDVTDRVSLQDLPRAFAAAVAAEEASHSCSMLLDLETLNSEDWQWLLGRRILQGTPVLRGGQDDHDIVLMVYAVLQNSRNDGEQQERSGTSVELLADYLDLVLVPMVLKRVALREDALQCPCEHCSNALQAIHQLKDRAVLTRLYEAGALSFLGRHLEEAADSLALGALLPQRLASATAAAGSLAVLAAYARLKENGLYEAPAGVVRSLEAVLRHASTLRHESTHLLALSLHVLRNVAGNHQEVMDMSADVFRDCFQLFVKDDGQGAAQSSQCTLAAQKSSSGGNPQESDECTSEGLHGRAKDADSLKALMPARRFRCCERLGLLSVTFQALFQSQGTLQNLVVSEEEIRQEVAQLASELRAELPQTQRTRISFHSIRLYLLICRSSHARRQYAILEPPVLEAEQRTVAFLLSISTSQHCVLLRAMTQDVHSWLLWQSQASKVPEPPEPRKRRSHKSKSRHTEPQAAESEEISLGAGSSSPHRVRLFTAGEAIWMAHFLLVLAVAVCLLVYWSSLEHTAASQAAARNSQLAGYVLYWR